MSTTDLFVELMVIGIGGAVWLALLVLGVFGYDWVPVAQMSSLAILIPALSVVYVLGIVIDRIADAAFEKLWGQSLLNKVYESKDDYFHDRRVIYIHPGRLGDLLEYGRSRIRICRGWTLNAVLILLSLDAFIWTRVVDANLRWWLLSFCSLAIGLFAGASWFTWRQLVLVYYGKIQGQSAFLRAVRPQDKKETENADSQIT